MYPSRSSVAHSSGRQKPIILVAEATERSPVLLDKLLQPQAWDLLHASGSAETLRILQTASPHVIVLGSRHGDSSSALELAAEIRSVDYRVPVVFLASDSSEDLAIAAIRVGVTDYVKERVQPDELLERIKRAFQQTRWQETSESQVPALNGGDRLVGCSLLIGAIRSQIQNLATAECNVLISGETGTGKQLVAELLHVNGPRRLHHFASINCAAIPDSLVESELFGHEKGAFTNADGSRDGLLKRADKGTALLDEIGDMSPCAQAKVLHAIETKVIRHVGGDDDIRVNVRILAATNHDLNSLVLAGKFRQDLYYRLAVGCINIPALREHREDVPLLLQHCINELNERFGWHAEGFTAEVIEHLVRYSWPGNIRELRNFVEAVLVNLPPNRRLRRIGLADLPQALRQRIEGGDGFPLDEKGRLLSALLSTNWNKTKAAEKLRWSRMTLYRKLTKYQFPEQPG